MINSQSPMKKLRSAENYRGSRFRGPSRNRSKWQVMKMINKKNVRIGAIKTEEDAARLYDVMAILAEGMAVKTNYDYTISDIQRI